MRRMVMLAIWATLAGSLGGGLAGQRVSIVELPEIARNRAERQRPVQEQALQPFWADLALDYEFNREFLEARIQEVAALGDTAVPLLLEKLEDADAGPDQRRLAANCARVLERLDPASFTEALLEMAVEGGPGTRRHAVRLLGHTRSERAARTLAGLLPGLETESDRVTTLEALTRLRAAEAAVPAAALLDGGRNVRRAVLGFLNTTAPPAVAGEVLAALATEEDSSLLLGYVEYLGKVVRADADAATALLPLLGSGRLEPEGLIVLCEALARVAPDNHEPTTAALRGILEGGQEGVLGRTVSAALLRLGDQDGAEILAHRLDAKVRRNRNDSGTFYERGELYFALGDWMKAIADYRQAVKLGTRRETRLTAHLMIARCEAQLGRPKNVLSALRDSGASRASILLEASADPVLERLLAEDIIARWLQSLPRD